MRPHGGGTSASQTVPGVTEQLSTKVACDAKHRNARRATVRYPRPVIASGRIRYRRDLAPYTADGSLNWREPDDVIVGIDRGRCCRWQNMTSSMVTRSGGRDGVVGSVDDRSDVGAVGFLATVDVEHDG